ncbi:MAG TPA: hypothetical protein VFC19_22455 [Candidatus Limnocylindrales bacterium]|nr:hypothetical protein [Candidatus Limnocylindrales bacterium]
MSDFVDSPNTPLKSPPAGYRGGPGTYDGEKGYPGRTPSPNAVPEKVRDGSVPTTQDTAFNGSGGYNGPGQPSE